MILETNKHLYHQGMPVTTVLAEGRGSLTPRYGYQLKSSRGNLYHTLSTTSFEYDFSEINRIIDTETFVARIFKKKKDYIVKEDPILTSDNKKNLKYLNARFNEILYCSGIDLSDFLESLAESLVNYNNAFILTVRKSPEETGTPNLFKLPPIQSVHVLSPLKLKPVINNLGDTLGYRYYKDSTRVVESIYIPKDFIYHIAIDKKLDLAIGTPSLEAVKDDILSLRQIEEAMERLIYKNASPLLHAKVGSDEAPASMLETGELEIDYYNDLISRMDDEGGLTTSHRVDIELLGTESKALRFESSMQYYKVRVVSGLGASLLDIGEAPASLSTAGAEAISQVLKDDVIAYQKSLAKFFTDKLFLDILLDAEWNTSKYQLDKKDKVVFSLPVSNLANKIKEESHLANMVNSKLMTREQFSDRTGYELPPEVPVTTNTPVSTAALSNVSQPQNQHTDYNEVLDEFFFDEEYLFRNIYLYLSTNFNDVEELKSLDLLAKALVTIINRYQELDYPIETLETIFYDSLKHLIFNAMQGE